MKSSFKLSVLMPVFNEEKTVQEIVRLVLAQPDVHELIVVNDGSTDRTAKILSKLRHKKLKVINHKQNYGKGKALQTALAKAIGDFVLVQDADLEYDPRDYQELIRPVKDGKATVVYGSRFLGPHRNMLFWHRLANSCLNLLINILYDTTLSDCETCYKLLPRELAKSYQLSSQKFDIEIELTCKVLRQNTRIYEVPISYTGREYSEGKKIGSKDALVAFLKVLYYRYV